jgi:hypothetical protein
LSVVAAVSLHCWCAVLDARHHTLPSPTARTHNTGSVTATNVLGQPGLQATLTATLPAALNKGVPGMSPSASLTVDYIHTSARLRWGGESESVAPRQQGLAHLVSRGWPICQCTLAHHRHAVCQHIIVHCQMCVANRPWRGDRRWRGSRGWALWATRGAVCHVSHAAPHMCARPPHTPPTCRAVLSPSDPTNLLRSLARPAAQLSGVTAVGPCVLGARVGADASSTGSLLTSWSVGANFTRMAADGPGGVERLSGQQVG